MKQDFYIRSATTSDAEALLEIYRPYVEKTAISFELVVPTLGEFEAALRRPYRAGRGLSRRSILAAWGTPTLQRIESGRRTARQSRPPRMCIRRFTAKASDALYTSNSSGL